MNRPRILIFSLAYFPHVGGAEVAVKKITDRLPDYDFELITLKFSKDEEPIEKMGNVLVRRVSRGRRLRHFFPIAATRLASRLHRSKPYDLVWAVMANQAGMAGASFKRRFPKVPFLLILQEGDNLNSFAYRLRLLGPKLWQVFKRADEIQTISHYLADWARQMGAKCPIVVIPNGVDLGNIKLQARGYPPRRRAGKLQANPIIITTSRLVKKNGVDTLIEALRFLPENIKLQILGTGLLKDKLKLQATSHKLQARVEFLGQINPTQVAEYLSQADVFARPSRSEGLGNSFLEAMAAGLPTIGTPVGGIPDFLKEGETGWLCPPDNPRALAEKIDFVLDPAHKEEVTKITTQAQLLVRQNYDWQAISQKMSKIIDNLTSVDKI